MSTDNTQFNFNSPRSNLTITTITFAGLLNRLKSHSNNEYVVAKGTIDFPLDERRKSSLTRVRQLLLEENTILSGDFLSSSVLNIDCITFGNHEFVLNKTELRTRINESKFTWIISNVIRSRTDQSILSTIRYKILSIYEICILLTINIKCDVLVALTHLDLEINKQLAENISEINLITGRHAYEDYFLLRGSEYIPITKADANAFTGYIHRCTFNLNTKRFHVYQPPVQITSKLEDEQKTAK
ncbi:unnamed protein product, partial [Rotaria sp. Silwood2]